MDADRGRRRRNLGEACHMYDVFRSLAKRAGDVGLGGRSIRMRPRVDSYLRNDNFVATTTYSDGSVATLTCTALGPKGGPARAHRSLHGGGLRHRRLQADKRVGRRGALERGDADKEHAEEMSLLGRDRDRRTIADRVRRTHRDERGGLRVEDLLAGRGRRRRRTRSHGSRFDWRAEGAPSRCASPSRSTWVTSRFRSAPRRRHRSRTRS